MGYECGEHCGFVIHDSLWEGVLAHFINGEISWSDVERDNTHYSHVLITLAGDALCINCPDSDESCSRYFYPKHRIHAVFD